MAWETRGVMDGRVQFVALVLEGVVPMSVACARFGISRKCGYKWLERYERLGPAGLEDRSRAPLRCPHAVGEEVAARIIAFKRAHMDLGPKKIVALLCARHPEVAWPAPSTAGDILARAQLVGPRQRRARATPAGDGAICCDSPNELWCADFKGWFETGDGRRCTPLTISDAHTRYFLRCQGMGAYTGYEQVRPLFEACFREHGLPLRLRTDNGPPFASVGLGGLSRLCVWWMRLGIRVERIRPGHPEQNGRLERLHRTLKQYTATPPQATLRKQQDAFRRFMHYYNHERPHEALGQKAPATLYVASPLPFPARLPLPEYPSHYTVRKVDDVGRVRWHTAKVPIALALTGQDIAFEPIEDARYRVWFMNTPLAIFDEKRMCMRPLKTAQSKAPHP